MISVRPSFRGCGRKRGFREKGGSGGGRGLEEMRFSSAPFHPGVFHGLQDGSVFRRQIKREENKTTLMDESVRKRFPELSGVCSGIPARGKEPVI